MHGGPLLFAPPTAAAGAPRKLRGSDALESSGFESLGTNKLYMHTPMRIFQDMLKCPSYSCADLCIHLCVYVYILYVYIYIHLHICIYIYIYICVYMYNMHMYVYAYACVSHICGVCL